MLFGSLCGVFSRIALVRIGKLDGRSGDLLHLFGQCGNLFAVGIGSNYSLRPSLNVRIDYEYQRWNGFPPNGLSPEVFSFGVAYHFH